MATKPKAPKFPTTKAAKPPVTKPKKAKGVACRALGAATLALIVSASGCAATQAYVAHHPDQADVIGAVQQGIACADPLVATLINGASWQELTAGALSCVIGLIDGGKLKAENRDLAMAAAEEHLQVARDKVAREAVMLRAKQFTVPPLSLTEPKQAN
jgi:hypothetical protein